MAEVINNITSQEALDAVLSAPNTTQAAGNQPHTVVSKTDDTVVNGVELGNFESLPKNEDGQVVIAADGSVVDFAAKPTVE